MYQYARCTTSIGVICRICEEKSRDAAGNSHSAAARRARLTRLAGSRAARIDAASVCDRVSIRDVCGTRQDRPSFLAGRARSCRRRAQLPRIFRASSRISSRSILNLSVLSGMPSARAVAVTFQPPFSSARMMKLRSNVETARSSRFSVAGPVGVELGDVELVGQVLVGDPVLVGDRHQPLDQVLELADVPRPPVRAEDLQRRIGDALDVLPELDVVAAQEEPRELRQVLDAVAQRRHPDRDDVEPVDTGPRGTSPP